MELPEVDDRIELHGVVGFQGPSFLMSLSA